MCHEKSGNPTPHVSLEYVTGSFVFRWQATPNGYDSHIQIFTRRHFDNARAGNTPPWAFTEIKVKTDNGEFIVNPEYAHFVNFCEDWINNPMQAERWARSALENKNHADYAEKHKATNSNPEIVELHDAPFIGYKPRILDV